jgi:hypothetical protein
LIASDNFVISNQQIMGNPRIMESLSEGRKDRLSLHQLEQRRTEIQAFEVAIAESIRLASGLNVLPALMAYYQNRKPARLRDFFKLGRPPEAPGTPLWSSTLPPPPPPPPVWECPALATRKAFRLARALRDSRILIASLRWYDAYLIPGEEILLKPPRREKYRKLNFHWRYYLRASRCVSGVVVRKTDPLARVAGYYIRHRVWRQLQIRFGFENDERMDWLFDPAIEAQFKAVPTDFKITTEQMTNLDARIGAVLLEKTRNYLLRDIGKETREMFELQEAEHISRRSNSPPPASNETRAFELPAWSGRRVPDSLNGSA